MHEKPGTPSPYEKPAVVSLGVRPITSGHCVGGSTVIGCFAGGTPSAAYMRCANGSNTGMGGCSAGNNTLNHECYLGGNTANHCKTGPTVPHIP